MKHFAYSCPGLSGPNCRMDIQPVCFKDLFSSTYPIVIPIFQRQYCWSVALLKNWWCDSTKTGIRRAGRADIGGGMVNTGKTSFKLVGEGSGRQLLCIDGQQRSTSMCLLLVAIRDQIFSLLSTNEVSKREIDHAMHMINEIQQYLFLDPQACMNWAMEWAASHSMSSSHTERDIHDEVSQRWETTLVAGQHLDVHFTDGSRLQPSYMDRQAFYELLTHGLVSYACYQQGRIPPVLSTPTQQSLQGLAHTIFTTSAHSVVSTTYMPAEQKKSTVSPSSSKVTSALNALRKAYINALNGFGVMYCEILTPISLPQVFLWMQEKTLLGMGALLRNDNPGIPFTAGDLTRNLLLSELVMGGDHTTQWNPHEQDHMYYDHWIAPIAIPASQLSCGLDGLIASFVEHVSELERGTDMKRCHNALNDGDDGDDHDCDQTDVKNSVTALLSTEGDGDGDGDGDGEKDDKLGTVFPAGDIHTCSSSSSSSYTEPLHNNKRKSDMQGSSPQRYIGTAERTISQMLSNMSSNSYLKSTFGAKLEKGSPLDLYGRLHSHCEWTQLRLEGRGVDGSGSVNKDEEEELVLSVEALSIVVSELQQYLTHRLHHDQQQQQHEEDQRVLITQRK